MKPIFTNTTPLAFKLQQRGRSSTTAFFHHRKKGHLLISPEIASPFSHFKDVYNYIHNRLTAKMMNLDLKTVLAEETRDFSLFLQKASDKGMKMQP